MKQGRSLQELAAEIERQANVKRDFVAPLAAVGMTDGGRLEVKGAGVFGVNDIAHRQIAEFADVPAKYYDRLRVSHPALLATTVNTLLTEHKADKRMIRTLDGTARAFLSDRYRPLDNVDLMRNVLPYLLDRPELAFASADVTERRLYLKIISRELVGEVKRGDEVRAGIVISNSEVGSGSLMVAPFTERLVCLNGMTHVNLAARKAHLGRAFAGDDDAAAEYLTDEARQADDRAYFLKARDTIAGMLDGRIFERLLTDMREATTDKVDGGAVEATVDAVAVQFGLNESERANVLSHLIEGADLSRWGVANAVTRAAADADTYDRASELERAGGDLLITPLAQLAPAPVKVRRARAKSARPAELVA